MLQNSTKRVSRSVMAWRIGWSAAHFRAKARTVETSPDTVIAATTRVNSSSIRRQAATAITADYPNASLPGPCWK
jgi:hypothetical protein